MIAAFKKYFECCDVIRTVEVWKRADDVKFMRLDGRWFQL